MTFSIDRKRSIGQAAKEVGVPEHVIRFWGEQFPSIKPTIGNGKRRYFYNKDIKILKEIKHRLYEDGYTIKGLQKLFATNNFTFNEEREEKTDDYANNFEDINEKINSIEAKENYLIQNENRYLNNINNIKIKEKLKILKIKLNIFYEKLKSI